MIAANELRIGNWVKVGGIESTVCLIDHYSFIQLSGNSIVYRPEQIDPIPLTPEILERCGFEINHDLGYCSDDKERVIYELNGYYVSFEDNRFFIWNEVEGDSYFSSAWPEIKNLHTLQNKFYFDKISGEELEFKESVTQ